MSPVSQRPAPCRFRQRWPGLTAGKHSELLGGPQETAPLLESGPWRGLAGLGHLPDSDTRAREPASPDDKAARSGWSRRQPCAQVCSRCVARVLQGCSEMQHTGVAARSCRDPTWLGDRRPRPTQNSPVTPRPTQEVGEATQAEAHPAVACDLRGSSRAAGSHGTLGLAASRTGGQPLPRRPRDVDHAACPPLRARSLFLISVVIWSSAGRGPCWWARGWPHVEL